MTGSGEPSGPRDPAPPVDNRAEHERDPLHPGWWVILFVAPLVLFVFTQLDIVQNARGHFVNGLTSWDLGKKDILADIIAPVWVVSIIVVGAINRRLLNRFSGDPEFTPTTRLGKAFGSETWVRRSTWFTTALAGAIVLMSWTREWDRFGQQPSAFWFVLTIVVTIGISIVPIWWIRHDLFTYLHDAVAASPAAARMDNYLFSKRNGQYRWTQLVIFASLTGLVAFIVLGQLDSLLRSMHPTGDAQVGINGLASVFELDLSVKPGEISQRVMSWVDFAVLVGPGFATALTVATAYLVIDTFLLAPAYAVVIGVLLLHARRTQPKDLQPRAARSYTFLVGIAIAVTGVIVASDVLENLMTWSVINSVWQNPGTVSSWTVRLMWFAALFRTLGIGVLLASGVLILAFRRERLSSAAQTLIAIRGEILVLVFLFLGLSLAQTADVIRGWTVSIALLTTLFATALAMVLFWTSTRTLASLRSNERKARIGETQSPSVVRVPWQTRPVRLRQAVVTTIVAIAALQILLLSLTSIPAGLGFTIPVAIIGILWLFGIPLPEAPFIRGDRSISESHRNAVPRILGSLVFVILGLATIRSAVPQLVYAGHTDWWLLFLAIPAVIGVFRLVSKKGPHVGVIEFVTVAGVGAVGFWLIATNGNPELSPVALMFSGVMILYGAMPFYYSYDQESGPSHVMATYLSSVKVQPLLTLLAATALIVSASLILFPVRLGGKIGTTAILILGATVFATFSAAAVRFAEQTRPPKILAAFRLKRTPVFVFLAVWLVLAGIAATGASNDVDVITDSELAAHRTGAATVDDLWQRWSTRNDRAHGEGDVIPMVFVASSGGGLRAAVWTSYVMDCVFGSSSKTEPACSGGEAVNGTEAIVAVSGVSGGSLGLASYFGSHKQPSSADDWVKDRLGDDYLAAPTAWLLFVDTPRSFIGFGPQIRDRADIMESTWERSWYDGDTPGFLSRGMFEIWEEEPDIPSMVFNGTNVPDPCRFNASVVKTTAHDPDDTCTSLGAFEGTTDGVRATAALAATKDLADYLCDDQDIRISTAALLSARFPIVTPSGRIGQELEHCQEGPRDAYVVDGGYLEGSAAGTVSELWASVQAKVDGFNRSSPAGICVVPFLIQIDNGYEQTAAASPGSAPKEVLVPMTSLLGSQFGRMASAREEAAITFDLPFHSAGAEVSILDAEGKLVRSRYARLTTRAHPGVQAPLGWTLSSASFDDLKAQLLTEENQRELEEVSQWLGGGLTCSSA